LPRQAIYKPAGVALSELQQVRLKAEELEALRLADLKGLTQAQAAKRMGVSRSTFQRIAARARRQVALALSDRQALYIEGQTVDTDARPAQRGQRRTNSESSVS
jgi:predicted DNA-binding protein (UPF0251 family)